MAINDSEHTKAVNTAIPPGAWNPGALHTHFTTRLQDIEASVESRFSDLQGQIDRRLEVQLRERQEGESNAKQRSDELARRVEVGDQALREHISQQVVQIRDALDSARREADLRFGALSESTLKLEQYVEKRLMDSNRFREQILEERGDYMPREAIEAQFARVEEKILALHATSVQRAGVEMEQQRRHSQIQPWMLWAAGGLLTTAIVVVNLVIAIAN